MTLVNIPETTWAYLAGLVDGEGYLKIWHIKRHDVKRGYAREYRLAIAVDNIEVLEKLQNELGLGKIYLHKQHKDENGYSESWDLRFWAGACRIILPKIIPYLRIKKRLAEIMVQCLDSIKDQGKIEELEKQFDYEFYQVLHKGKIGKGWNSHKA